MTEARLNNGVPQTAGWFVVNVRDARCAASAARAGVTDATASPDDVYGRFGAPEPGPAPEIF